MADTRFAANDYDAQWAALGDFVRYNPGARHRRRLVVSAVADLARRGAPLDVLDVGCGPGELYLVLSRRFPSLRYHGIDLSGTAIQHAREVAPAATWTLHDLTTGPLATEHSLVVCSEVTEHLAEPSVALEHISAMTSMGGFLVLTTPHGRIHTTERAVGHVHHPTREELTGWLTDAGFRIRSLRQWGWPAYTAVKYAGDLAPGQVLDHLGAGTYGRVARAANSAAYWATMIGSLPTSRWGPQFVAVAERVR